jgi:hypothetical protein
VNFKKLTPPINISPRYVCTFWLLSTNFNVYICFLSLCIPSWLTRKLFLRRSRGRFVYRTSISFNTTPSPR